MSKKTMPENIQQAWNEKKGPVVFTTVNADGSPNAIYATCVALYEENSIIVANNYFSKTIENIEAGCKGSILFITEEDKAYQIKGNIEHFIEGPVYDNMKSWNPDRLP